jgi:hypothetical protein
MGTRGIRKHRAGGTYCRLYRTATTVTIGATLAMAAAGCVTPTVPVWVTENLDGCQKGIESESSKLDKKLFSAMKKCKDAYRKAVLGGDALGDAAVTTCDKALSKVVVFPDPEAKSALAKTKEKLDKLTAPERTKCTDENLIALGHLPTTEFSDVWARLIMVQRIKDAYENQASVVADTGAIFSALADAGCVQCKTFTNPPCSRRVCAGVVNIDLEELGLAAQTTALIPMDMCSNSGILGPDMAVVGGQDVILGKVDLIATGQTICLHGERILGRRAGLGTSASAVNLKICQDHIQGDGNECSGICSTPQADTEHVGVTNGGACIAFTDDGPAGEGESILLARAQMSVVCDGVGCGADTRGPDTLPCTADDTAPVRKFIVPLTTSESEAEILDADNTDGVTITSISSPGAPIDFDNVTPALIGTWVGKLPGLHGIDGSPDTDDIVRIEVECS